ncbi:MAG: glycosyltransferase family 4 protein [Deltaproteobacteria bacterium]|nr:glycosyltransferase family 4 protein [Deltaproteobacteria bacterium]
MRIGIIAHDLTQAAVRGWSRYAAGLVRALAATGSAEVVLFARRPLAPIYDDLPGRRCIWPGRREVVWEQWELPRRAAARGVDVLHAPSNRGLCAFAPCPTVVTRHDAIERMFAPDFPGSLRSRLRLYYADAVAMRRASAIATVSETSKRDIVKTWSLDGARVVVAGEGIDDRFFMGATRAERERVRGYYGLEGPYLLYLGGMDRRKDVVTLVDAYAAWGRRDIPCLIAGSTRGESQPVNERVARYGLASCVRVLGEIAEDDVRGLYAGAAAFAYPSRYEGFGLQAVEAMAMGVPAVVSDGGALPEVVGDAALVFRAGDASALANCLDRLFADEQLRYRLIERGWRRASRFRWEHVIARYLSLYRNLGAQPAPQAAKIVERAPSRVRTAAIAPTNVLPR